MDANRKLMTGEWPRWSAHSGRAVSAGPLVGAALCRDLGRAEIHRGVEPLLQLDASDQRARSARSTSEALL